MALAHIFFFAVMAMFLFPWSKVFDHQSPLTFILLLFRLGRILKEVSIFLIYMIHSSISSCSTQQQIILISWCQVILLILSIQTIIFDCIAYSANRLNVLFFVVFVIIGNAYELLMIYLLKLRHLWNTKFSHCSCLSSFSRLFFNLDY